MKYQPNQELSDYETSDLVTSSVITGDFTTDSLKYGFGPTSGRAAESEHRYGVAVLEHDPMSSTHPKVSGTVHFEDTGEGLKIDYEIRGLYNGLHGFHIHEYGDLTDGCTSACAHFNPDNETHGGLDTETRHMGDLGNISSEDRVSKGSLFLPQAKLDSSKYGVLGRMVIVHADEDDLGTGGDEESLKTGNAGKRLACGVIGLAEPPQKLRGEMEEYAPNETDDSFTSMSNLAYITLPDYDESYYWISDDENSRATVAFDEENEVIIIPNFEVSLRVRGQGMASQYLHEMIDDLHSDFGYYPVQVIDVDNHAIGFWEKMQNQGVIDGWTQGRTFQAEDDYDATYGKAQAKIRRRLKKKIMGQAIMGTAAGEWSARKSQELKRQYEAACEKAGLKPYKGSKTKSQDNLSNWSKQNWRTASGKKSSKTGEPYFPAKAVAELKKKNLYSKAIRQKKAATQAGKQHARYSDDIRAVVKKYRAEEPWDSGERFSITPRDLEREIADGLHTNSSGDLGCPSCGNIDYFWKTVGAKGTKYRCMMCEYTDDYETVKSQGDITLEKFGLTVECPICEESISAYNQDSINRHLRKHEKEAAEASEPKVSEAEWDMTINWNSRCPKCGKSADNPIRTKEYDGYVRTTYYCDCDVGQPDPDFENRFIREYRRWFDPPGFAGHDPNQVLYGDTTVSPPCMNHYELFPGESSFIGYNVDEIASLEEWLERNRGLRVSLPRPEPEQTLGPDDVWLEVWAKPGEKPSAQLGDAGETICAKCVEKLMSGATYRRGYRPSRMIRWSDWKNDDWDKTVELPAVSEAEDIQFESDDYALVVGDLSDTEQLSLEIEDIDETYGLINLSEIETSVQEFAVNAAGEMMEDYSDIMPCVAIVFVSDSFSAHHVARYRSQTVGNCPIVMLSLSAIKDSAAEYDVPLNLAVATSVWHELGHALDEYCLDYLNFDVVSDDDPEEFAESFARWYSGFSNLAPPSQEELFELSED
jgi:Cu-Zn family superoxide dismutase